MTDLKRKSTDECEDETVSGVKSRKNSQCDILLVEKTTDVDNGLTKMEKMQGQKNSPESNNTMDTFRRENPTSQSRGYFGERKGEREEMQDAHVILDSWTPISNTISPASGGAAPLIEQPANQGSSSKRHFCADIHRSAYYAVFDGHGGSRAAVHAQLRLHEIIGQKLAKGPDVKTIEQSMKKALIESYKKLDEEFLVEATKRKPVWKDGTTATTLLLLNDNLFVANLGDSRAILCRYKPGENKEIALTLTKDHSPFDFQERMRIQKAGGTVKDGRIMGILEVSRSIGDGQYKAHGVSCLPDVKKCTLTENDRYVLIACDGLWKTFSNQEALAFVAENLEIVKKDDKKIRIPEGSTLEQVQWEMVCGNLAAEAVRKGCGDNVTVVIVKLSDW